jgi:hypothetical protein
MKFADLALGESHDPRTGKAQALVHAGNVLLVARQAVERFGQHDLKLPRLSVAQQRLDARPHEACAGNAVIGVALDDGPALARGALFTETYLTSIEASRCLSEE